MPHEMTWSGVNRHRRWNPNPSVGHGWTHYELSESQMDQIEEMSVYHIQDSEIAHMLGVSERVFDDLKNRDEEIVKRICLGRSKGKRLLRMKQFQVALQGNVSMLIYLGRVILGQIPADAVQLSVSDTGDIIRTPIPIPFPILESDISELQLSQEAIKHLSELAVEIQRIAVAANARDLEGQALTDVNGEAN
jgi:hypothetical protein